MKPLSYIVIGIIELVVFTVISYILSTFTNKKKEANEIDKDALRQEILEELRQENIINENNELIEKKQEEILNEEDIEGIDDDVFFPEMTIKCPYCNSKNFIEIEESLYLCNSCKAKFSIKQ